MEVNISRNYEMFGLNKKKNRPINKSNVKKLKIEISKVGIINPILVDSNFNILDGQHRFAALKELGRSVPYIINQTLSPEYIPKLNASGTAWKLWDYICSYANEDDDYLKLKDKINEYKFLGVSTACVIFSAKNTGRLNITKLIKIGEFEFKDRSVVASYLQEVREHHLSMPTNTAIAIKEIMEENEMFDRQRFLRFIKQGTRIPNFNDVKPARKYVSDFYNFRLRSENKIY